MAERIEANYQMLQQVAAKFMQQNEAVASMVQDLQSRADALDGQWMGKGYEAFSQEMSQLILPVCNRVAEALLEASQMTNQIAATMQEAEDQAAQQFEMLVR